MNHGRSSSPNVRPQKKDPDQRGFNKRQTFAADRSTIKKRWIWVDASMQDKKCNDATVARKKEESQLKVTD
jgi:hypothetical protein